MSEYVGFGTVAADKPLSQLTIERRDVGKDDVKIDILYCGVCHSDLHFARNEWHFTVYPAVPGHEIVGRVAQVGIVADVEVIPMQKINEAYERMLKSDVKYRFSIDMATL